MTVVLVLAVVVALHGCVRAVRRCRAEVQAARARARRRAEVAAEFDRASRRWDAHTARLAAALAPLLAETGTTATVATAGFGDAIVAEERIAQAFRSIDPPPVLVEETPW